MEIRIPYGRSYLTARLPEGISLDFIEAPKTPAAIDPDEVVRACLENLLGEIAWSDFAMVKSVAIAINDKTRPVPHQYLLPPLMERLESLGIADGAITLFVAGGSHAPMRPDEFPEILPVNILNRYRVAPHNAEDSDRLVYLGDTSQGTPIWSNKDYVQSELKIVVGNIEPHQIVGFSGGVKSAAIGLAGLKTINHNHAMMAHPDAQLGEYQTNPARQDVEEIGRKIGVHLALNAILNQDKQIVKALAGEPQVVMQEGALLSREISQIKVPHRYDLVICSPGGHPKDINVYQAQKGLTHAARVTKLGGTLLVAAACPEGSGSQHYEEWMVGKNSYSEVIQQFRQEGFRIGPHKAYQIARDASNVRLMWYSELDEGTAKALLLNPVKDFKNAVDLSLAELAPEGRVGVMPHAVSTIPYLVRT